MGGCFSVSLSLSILAPPAREPWRVCVKERQREREKEAEGEREGAYRADPRRAVRVPCIPRTAGLGFIFSVQCFCV